MSEVRQRRAAVALHEGSYRRVFGRLNPIVAISEPGIWEPAPEVCKRTATTSLIGVVASGSVAASGRKHRRPDIRRGNLVRLRRLCRPGPVGRRSNIRDRRREPSSGANAAPTAAPTERDRQPGGGRTNAARLHWRLISELPASMAANATVTWSSSHRRAPRAKPSSRITAASSRWRMPQEEADRRRIRHRVVDVDRGSQTKKGDATVTVTCTLGKKSTTKSKGPGRLTAPNGRENHEPGRA